MSTPSASAPTWDIEVVTPMPNSCALVCMTTLPSLKIRARACCTGMKNATG